MKQTILLLFLILIEQVLRLLESLLHVQRSGNYHLAQVLQLFLTLTIHQQDLSKLTPFFTSSFALEMSIATAAFLKLPIPGSWTEEWSLNILMEMTRCIIED